MNFDRPDACYVTRLSNFSLLNHPNNMKYSSVSFYFILGPAISLSTVSLRHSPTQRLSLTFIQNSKPTYPRHSTACQCLTYRSDISEPTHSLRTSTRYTSRCTEYGNSTEWFWSLSWQILTQEDWNVVLFNGMEKTSHWAALYFVALMTFGNYVLFNLLVAILVEGFSAEVCCSEVREV